MNECGTRSLSLSSALFILLSLTNIVTLDADEEEDDDNDEDEKEEDDDNEEGGGRGCRFSVMVTRWT